MFFPNVISQHVFFHYLEYIIAYPVCCNCKTETHSQCKTKSKTQSESETDSESE